jgi:uncharacterized BrkB/YihY/UPF0761 family membrane protein
MQSLVTEFGVLRARTIWNFVKRTTLKSWDDEIFGESARLAFYFFFAMFPLLLLLSAFLEVLHAAPEWSDALLAFVQQIMPPDAAALVRQRSVNSPLEFWKGLGR